MRLFGQAGHRRSSSWVIRPSSVANDCGHSLLNQYVDALFSAWQGRVPREADFVCYWHERARELIETGQVSRAGLLATQGIRGGANRKVLEAIKESGDIFMAWSDEPWVVEGADVRVSIIGQDGGREPHKVLDGKAVEEIHADLSAGGKGRVDVIEARSLPENLGVSFMGDSKGGDFDIPLSIAETLLSARGNVDGRPNSDVVRPWANGHDVNRRPRDFYIIDFGVDMPEEEAAAYEAPVAYVRKHVYAGRQKNNRDVYREKWWIHVEPRPAMRVALEPLSRFIGTVRHSKHRLFVWLQHPTLPDSALIVFARDDDYTFGVLHSRIHEVWALRLCTWVGVGNDPRYTPSTTFETFPFPWPLNTPDTALTGKQRKSRDAIAEGVRRLNDLRSRWLSPPELVKPVPNKVASFPPRMVPVDLKAAEAIKTRTLTNLYNEPPDWLKLAHDQLNAAVFAAYDWDPAMSDDEIAAGLLELNRARSGTPTERSKAAVAEKRWRLGKVQPKRARGR